MAVQVMYRVEHEVTHSEWLYKAEAIDMAKAILAGAGDERVYTSEYTSNLDLGVFMPDTWRLEGVESGTVVYVKEVRCR